MANKCYMRKIIGTTVLFLIAFSLAGQKNAAVFMAIDSLIEHGWALKEGNDLKKAETQASIALTIAEKVHYPKGIAASKNLLGVLCQEEGRYPESLSFFEAAKALRFSMGDSIGAANVLGNLGKLKQKEGQYDASVGYFLQAISIQQRFNNEKGLANAYMNLSNTYEKEGSLDKGLAFLGKSLEIWQKRGDSLKIIDCLHNMALLHMRVGDLAKATYCAKEVLSFCQKSNNIEEEIQILNLLADISTRRGAVEQAAQYYAIAAQKTTDSLKVLKRETVFSVYLNYATFQNNQNKVATGLSFLNKAAEWSSSAEEFEALALNKADAYAKLGKLDSALFYQTNANQWKDSIYNKNKAEAISKFETQFNTPQIRAQLNESILAGQQKTKQNNILMGILAAVPFILLLFAAYFWQKRRKDAIIAIQKEQLHHREIDRLLKDQEISTINAMLQGQEAERDRIAKDLHDEVGGLLTGLGYELEALVNDQRNEIHAQTLRDALKIVGTAYEETRRISHNLKSGVLAKFGIVMALRELAGSVNRGKSGLNATVFVHGMEENIPIDTKTESQLYRIVQELIANTQKHAKASQITIAINRFDHELNLTYEDDGIGFDPQKSGKGIGLKNIAARAHELGASMDIDSKLGSGVSVFIKIPI